MGINKRSENVSIVAPEVGYVLRGGAMTTSVLNVQRFNARRESQGVDLPGYQKLIANGEDATTPWSAKDTRVVAHSPATARAVYQAAGSSPFEVYSRQPGIDYLPGIAVPSELVTEANQSASSKFYGLYQTGPSTDLGVVAVELSETVSMLMQPYKRLVRAVLDRYNRARKLGDLISKSRGLRKLPPQRRLRAARRQWHDAYLETYFGVLPFMSEVVGILDDLDRLLTKPPLVQVKVGHTAKCVKGVSGKTNFQGIQTAFSRSSLCAYGVRYRGAYQAALSLDTDFHTPISTRADIMPALWEAIPLSWLSDYVFNTGQVLAAEQSAQALQWAWLCKTERYTQLDLVRMVQTNTNPKEWLKSFDDRPGYLAVEHKQLSRGKTALIPPPAHGLRHTPQTRVAALAAVASVIDARRLNQQDRKRFNSQLFN